MYGYASLTTLSADWVCLLVWNKKIKILVFAFVISGFSTPGFSTENDKTKIKTKADVIDYQETFIRYSRRYSENKNDLKALYNLGVISYKMQQYNQAEVYFKKLLSIDAYHLLAKYNLGLVAYKQGKRGAAINWFSQIVTQKHSARIATTPVAKKLKKLAQTQLKKLNAETAVLAKKNKQPDMLKTYFFAKTGHDDHVSDPLDNIITGDNFLKFYALFTVNLDHLSRGLDWRFSYYRIEYEDFNALTFEQLGTDFSKEFKQDRWQYLLRAGFIKSTFGPTDYQSIKRLEFKTSYRYSKNIKASSRFFYSDIASDDLRYDAYEGDQYRLDFQYEQSVQPHKFRLKLEYETNDRADQLTGTVIGKSYSPQRNKIEFTWFYQINKNWRSRLSHEFRDSRYNDYSFDDAVVRDEFRAQTTAGIRYSLKKGWWWVTEYIIADNKANITRYQYNRHIFSTGITAYF